VDNETVSLSLDFQTINIDTIKDFFNQYVKTYLPYSGNKVYDAIIDNLAEYYFNQLYNVIPQKSKELFDNLNISTTDIYDKFLIAIGLPQDLIRKMSYIDKNIFLRTLSDFERYKSSLSFVTNLGEAYSQLNKVNIYELYIDYDATLLKPWILKPVNIYKHREVDLNLTSLDYETIYNLVPSLLVDTNQLDICRSEESIILPLKTNLLFLNYDLAQHVSLLYDLIVAIFLREYRENNIDIYFVNTSKTSSLKAIYYAWYYLMTRYYDTTWDTLPLSFVLRFAYGDDVMSFPYTINDIDKLIAEYDNIETATQRDNFYKTRLADVFGTYFTVTTTTDSSGMLSVLALLDPDLAVYLDNRISTIEDSDKQKLEINIILTEIYNSLGLYVQTCGITNFTKYSNYLLSYLPQITVRPEDTTTYLILDSVKPYHTQLYTESKTGIKCNDKFNSVWLSDMFDFLMTINGIASAVTLSSKYHFLNTYETKDSTLTVISYLMSTLFKYLQYDDVSISDLPPEFFIEAPGVSAITLSSINYFTNAYKTKDGTLTIIDSILPLFKYLQSDNINISDLLSSFSIEAPGVSAITLSSINYLLQKYLIKDTMDIASALSRCLIQLLQTDDVNINELLSTTNKVPGSSSVVLSFKNSFLDKFVTTGSDNVNIVDDYVITKIP